MAKGVSVDSVTLGMLGNNVYYVWDGVAGLLVDPSCKPDAIEEWLAGRSVDAIMLTHYHFDHIGAANALRGRFGCKVYASAADAPYVEDPDAVPGWHRKTEACPVDVRVEDGETVRIGATDWQVLVTPGHSDGSMCWYAAPAAEAGSPACGVLLSGDTLFCGGIGRTDFIDGSPEDMARSLARLAQLPDATDVYPGHGPFTTIAAERAESLSRR